MTKVRSQRDWQRLSIVGNWDGSLAIPPDLDADMALREGLWLMESILGRKSSPCRVTPGRGRRPHLDEFGTRLRCLLSVSAEALVGELGRNTLHPHLDVLLSHLWHHDLGQEVRRGNWKSVGPQLQKVREQALSDEVQQKVKVFEELSRRRLEKNDRFTAKLLRCRPWMTVSWFQFAIARGAYSPPDTNAVLLKAALSEFTKKSKQWRTRITFSVDLAYREVMGSFFADVVLFFDANEDRSGEELAEMVRLAWGDITCGQGRFRHVHTIARRYYDVLSEVRSKALMTEDELKANVTNLMSMFAERTRYVRLSGIGSTHRSGPVKVLSHADQGLPGPRGTWPSGPTPRRFERTFDTSRFEP